MSDKRFDYIDAAKAYLIALVVIGHILIIINPTYDKLYLTLIQSFIYSFHMPAFFIIHGIVFNNIKWKDMPLKDFLVKRFRSLIVPYFVFEVIGMLWKAILTKQTLLCGIYNMLTIRCNVGADWFLPALFLASILFIIYVKIPNPVYGVISTIICLIIPMWMAGNQTTIVLGRGMLAYDFIMIGNSMKRIFLSEKVSKPICFILSFFITSIVAIVGIKFGENDFYSCIVQNPIMFVIGGISGTVMIVGIARLLTSRIVTMIGKHTLSIMGTHQLVIYALTAFYPGFRGGSIMDGFLLLAAIVVFEIVIIWLVGVACTIKTKLR